MFLFKNEHTGYTKFKLNKQKFNSNILNLLFCPIFLCLFKRRLKIYFFLQKILKKL